MKPSPAVSSSAALPDSLDRGLAHGISLLRAGRASDAAGYGASLLEAWPEQPRLFAFLADACQAAGDLSAALDWIDRAIGIDPSPRHKVKKAWLLSGALRRDEIPALAAQILVQADGQGGPGLLYWQVAKLYHLHNRLREAIDCYGRALQLEDRPEWRYDLALARFYAGDIAAAGEDLDALIARAPKAGTAVYLRSVLRRQRQDGNHVADIRARLDSGFLQAENRAAALYALAKELEDLGEHAESFQVLESAARAKRATFTYDIAAVTGGLAEIRTSMDTAAMAAPAQGHAEPGAIFIVGMPRTGTTLVQRLLRQSGRVSDAGELMDFGFHLTAEMERIRRQAPGLLPTQAALQADFAGLGRRYMRGARQMADGAATFIDKLPANFLYCGMIRRALPNARIIHLVRDPLDSCYAIFKTLFFSAYEFSYDQEELAEYYLAYRQLMQHWHEVMPGEILDVRYEDLVARPEEQSRRIYDWCGLDWSPQALAVPDGSVAFSTASAAQVREPVHSRSVHSSRRHVEGLGPLIDRLAAGGLLVGRDGIFPMQEPH